MPFIDQNLLNIDVVTNIPGGFFYRRGYFI